MGSAIRTIFGIEDTNYSELGSFKGSIDIEDDPATSYEGRQRSKR